MTTFTGGETEFPKLNKKYKLPPGDGVLWDMLNVDQNQVHPLAEHAGLTVKSGDKMDLQCMGPIRNFCLSKHPMNTCF